MKQLRDLIARNRSGSAEAMPSVCSANADVLAASILLAQQLDVPLLIEATSNQVNQFGGYTGMRPKDFVDYVGLVCQSLGVSRDRVLFGGDHLGPQAWRDELAPGAMAKARDLVAEYVAAGFTKIHLDCSEGCFGEPSQVGDMVSAARAAELAQICENATDTPETISYIFGTEVPPPGGARANQADQAIDPTSPEDALATIEAHRAAFSARGLETTAWPRAIGLVVQPGLEFAPDQIHRFNVNSADQLSQVLKARDELCFEAHSTDYQAPPVFPALAQRHFAVLKVGPALTYAYRQAIYALDSIAAWMFPNSDRASVAMVMEQLMTDSPRHWSKHYAGDLAKLRLLRHFGYADRIRYYWPQARAIDAVHDLMALLGHASVPTPLLEQFFPLPILDRADQLRSKGIEPTRSMILAQIQETLAPYFACYHRV
jgi:D-tagatose-1,6-bisphosphate aldolase subunit GatZ/KbaZ